MDRWRPCSTGFSLRASDSTVRLHLRHCRPRRLRSRSYWFAGFSSTIRFERPSMYCHQCGRQLPETAAFCGGCGIAMAPVPAAVPREIKNPGVAMLLSILIPGAGQLYNGQLGKGILVLLTCWLVIPYIYGIIDAWRTAERINRYGY